MEKLELRDLPAVFEANGLLGQYFHDKSFTEVGAVRVDAAVDFNWGTGSPSAGMAADKFAVRWTGTLTAPVSGNFTFFTRSDDGVRLWIGGQQLINNWTDHSVKEDNGSVSLTAGQSYDIRMEYYENSGNSQAALLWQLPGTNAKVIVPNSVLVPPTIAIPAEGSGIGLLAQYYGSKSLTDLAAIQVAATVNNDWANGSPTSTVSSNNFSARWTGQVQPRYSGKYTFTTTSDDGVRLWIDGQLLIDQWNDHSAKEHKATIVLNAGQKYDIKMEYYENSGAAIAKLAWASDNFQVREVVPMSQLYPASVPAPATGTGNGLLGEYFSTKNLDNLALTRVDSQIDHRWASGSPDPAIPADRFSARWSGLIQPRYSGVYTLSTFSDDGIRVWLDDDLILNAWNDHSAREDRVSVAFAAGQKYRVSIEYYENSGSATARLFWSSDYQIKEAVPMQQLYAQPAIAYWDEADTPFETPVSIDVLQNDYFAPSQSPSFSLQIVQQPLRGSAYVDDAGTPADPFDDRIVFHPAPGHEGPDSFIYALNFETQIVTASAHVLVGQAPVANRPNLGRPVGDVERNFVEVLRTLIRQNNDDFINPANPRLTLATINNLIADPNVTFEKAAAVAILKGYILQNPLQQAQLGLYARVFGLNNQSIRESNLLTFAAIRANRADERHANLEFVLNQYEAVLLRTAHFNNMRVFPDAQATDNEIASSIRQGMVGDCAFLAATISFIRNNGFNAIRGRDAIGGQDAIRSRIEAIAPDPANGRDRFRVRFYNETTRREAEIVVSDPTEAERALTASTTLGERWLPVWEKAYVTIWNRVNLRFTDAGLYDIIATGETADGALTRVSGLAARARPAQFVLAVFADQWLNVVNQQKMVTLGTPPVRPANAPPDLPMGHGFSLKAYVSQGGGRLTVQNPHGKPTRFGAEFQCTRREFESWFSTIAST